MCCWPHLSVQLTRAVEEADDRAIGIGNGARRKSAEAHADRCAGRNHGLSVAHIPGPTRREEILQVGKILRSQMGMTNDPAEVKADFARWPFARIGIPTGIVNGFIVIE